MALSIPILRRRPTHPEETTPNEPSFNAGLLLICLLVLAFFGFVFIHFIGFPTGFGR